jgi:hypothetical protein
MSIGSFRSNSIKGEDKTSALSGLNYISLKPKEKSKQISLSSKNHIGYRTVQPYAVHNSFGSGQNHLLFRASDGTVRCAMVVGGEGTHNFSLPFTSAATPAASGNITYGHGGGTSFGHDPPHWDAFITSSGPSIGGSSNTGTYSLNGRGFPGWNNSLGGNQGWVEYRVANSIPGSS